MENSAADEPKAQLRPRPALGLRPWFAFLRRARILRRFALAIERKGTRGRARASRVIALSHGDWDSGPLTPARTRVRRRHGLLPAPGPVGLLLRTRCIHGWGLVEPVRWIGLDGTGRVIATGVLRPRRVLVAPQPSCWIAEVPDTVPAPSIGEVLRVVPILAVWPDD